jgi:hypothetical protein
LRGILYSSKYGITVNSGFVLNMAIQDKYTVVESPDFNLPAVLERKRDLLKSHDNGWLYGQLNRLNSFYIST